jgi:putative transcriptional regulator
MTTPTQHPSSAVLSDYVSGALRPAFAAVVAAHLEACPHCRTEVRALETLGGAMIEDLSPAALSEGSVERVMAALEAAAPAAPEPPRPTLERIPFGPERWLAPGMSIRKAKPGEYGDLLYMLRLPSGQKTVPHGHQGVEFTTVLKGAYVDGNGRMAAGDFCELDDTIEHQPHVDLGGECICLVASEKPMRMFTRLGRFVHAITGV